MKIVSLGEILIRLTVPDHGRFSHTGVFRHNFGGSEMNVVVALCQLGWRGSFLTALPENPIASNCLRLLNGFGIDTNHIQEKGERIGLYFLEEGQSIRSSQIVYDRFNSSINAIDINQIDWDSLLNEATHLHWSAISPALSKNVAEVCLEAVKQAASRGLIVTADLHYRKNLWKYGKSPKMVIDPLLAHSNHILGDPTTISQLTGISMANINNTSIAGAEELKDDFHNLMDRYDTIKSVSMLLRTIHSANHHTLKGVNVNQSDAFESQSIDVDDFVDRIGGGDAFMAGLVHGLEAYEAMQDTIRFASMLSAFKHTIEGDYPLISAEEIQEIMETKVLGKIKR